MSDLEKLANILGADTIKKFYEDGLSKPVQVFGETLTDFLKVIRLFTAPIQLLANYQERLTSYLKQVEESVPKERQMQAPASISGPVIDRLKYQEEGSVICELYINLLTRAVDKDRISEAHPAFIQIIDQLSPDEALILLQLSKERIRYDYYGDVLQSTANSYELSNKVIKHDNIKKEHFSFPEHFEMYIDHLKALNLVRWKIIIEEAVHGEGNLPGTFQEGVLTKTRISLTSFGDLFAKACIPKDSFIILKGSKGQ